MAQIDYRDRARTVIGFNEILKFFCAGTNRIQCASDFRDA